MQDLVGRTFGQHQITATIGAGGMGSVFRARHKYLPQPRAIKVLPPTLALDPAFQERFLREATIVAGLRHPNVVQVFDFGEQDGLLYIVMELVDGSSLREVFTKVGPLSPVRAIHLLRQVASALDYVHSKGVVHRDLKPANLIVSSDEQVTVVDFGIASALGASRVTQTGMLVGTLEYLAPELVAGSPPGPSIDRYALGVVAFEMLTGRVPFAAPESPALLFSISQKPPPAPRSIRPELPPPVDIVLLRQLSKDPERRYPTCSLFVDALDAALMGKDAPGVSTVEIAGGAGVADGRGGRVRPALLLGILAAIACSCVVLTAAGFLYVVGAPKGDVQSLSTITPPIATSTALPPSPTALPPSATPIAAAPSPTTTISPHLFEAVQTAFGSLPGMSSAAAALPNGQRIEHNGDRQLASGSIIKLWIAATALDAQSAGRLDLRQSHLIKREDQTSGTGILQGSSYVGRSLSYLEILDTMFIYSDNTAANILIRLAGGFGSVNEFAKRNGYHQTALQRYLGQLDPQHENLTSARDCVNFFSRLLRGEIVDAGASTMIRSALDKRRANPDRSLTYFSRLLPGNVSSLNINGFIPGVRDEVGFFVGKGGNTIIAILLSQLSSEASGEEAIAHAVEQIYRASTD